MHVQYMEYAPHRSLARQVECYWSFRVEPGSSEETSLVYPDSCTDLILNRSEANLSWRAVGIQQSALEISHVEHRDVIGIRFKPGAMGLLMETPMDDLLDSIVEVSDIDSKHPFANFTVNCTWADIDARLRTLHQEARFTWNDVLESIDRMHADPSLCIARLSKSLGMSTRTLERKFLQQTGISPKRMMRILRFRQAKSALEQGISQAKIVERLGYYDQSHLLHELSHFSNTSVDDSAILQIKPTRS